MRYDGGPESGCFCPCMSFADLFVICREKSAFRKERKDGRIRCPPLFLGVRQEGRERAGGGEVGRDEGWRGEGSFGRIERRGLSVSAEKSVPGEKARPAACPAYLSTPPDRAGEAEHRRWLRGRFRPLFLRKEGAPRPFFRGRTSCAGDRPRKGDAKARRPGGGGTAPVPPVETGDRKEKRRQMRTARISGQKKRRFPPDGALCLFRRRKA